eukprot:GHVP01056991.1.p1 GENE.GHVP01056991.1~~GHVP01056991.1.p1  ORF type:complete len:211 (+),score=24.09 GHVP01056991.1:375-1007(+)
MSVYHRKPLVDGKKVHCKLSDNFREHEIPYPGFVEFEEQNGRIAVYSPKEEMFSFWDMKTYSKVFQVSSLRFREIRMSKSTVVFFEQPSSSSLKLRMCSLIDGSVLSEGVIPLLKHRTLEFLELCGSYLLVKQEDNPLRLHDLFAFTLQEIPGTQKFHPTAVAFFPHQSDFSEGNFKSTRTRWKFIVAKKEVLGVCKRLISLRQQILLNA